MVQPYDEYLSSEPDEPLGPHPATARNTRLYMGYPKIMRTLIAKKLVKLKYKALFAVQNRI